MDSPYLYVLLLRLLCTPLLRAAAQIIHSGMAQLRSKRTVDRSQEVGLHRAQQIANNDIVMTGVHLTVVQLHAGPAACCCSSLRN